MRSNYVRQFFLLFSNSTCLVHLTAVYALSGAKAQYDALVAFFGVAYIFDRTFQVSPTQSNLKMV